MIHSCKFMVKRYFNFAYLAYLYFAVMFIMVFLYVDPMFREEDCAIITKIFHPEYNYGEYFRVSLDGFYPYFNYHYIVAFLTKLFGFSGNPEALRKVFWLLQSGVALIALTKLCNLVFNRDRLALTIVITLSIPHLCYLFGTVEPRNLATALFFFALYYLLRERWSLAIIFCAIIMYIHVGVGIWWYLSSCTAIGFMCIVQKKIPFKVWFIYAISVSVFVSPIIFVCLISMLNSSVDVFTLKYYYYITEGEVSPLLSFINFPITVFTNLWLKIVLLLIGYSKARQMGYRNDKIIPIVISFVFLYFVQFLFLDLLGFLSFTRIQLSRAMILLDRSLWFVFFGFLLTKGIKDRKYFLFFAYLIIFFGYGIVKPFLGDNKDAVLVVFFSVLLACEFFERRITWFIERIYKRFIGFSKMHYIDVVSGKVNKLMCRSEIIATIIFVMFLIQFSPVKLYIKSILGISNGNNDIITTREESYKEGLKDVFRYVNNEIPYDETLFLVPFNLTESYYYTHHKVININRYSPIIDLQFASNSSREFQYIFENDLHCSIEKMFIKKDNRYSWDEMWRNLDEETIKHWKEKYKLTHVIREKDLPLNFPIAYHNKFYIVYRT